MKPRIRMELVSGLLLLLVAGPLCGQEPVPPLHVRSDFPGGSVEVLEVDSKPQIIRINPRNQPERGWVCWWSFRVNNLRPGQPLILNVGEGGWATPDQAFFRVGEGPWQQTLPGKREGKRIVYSLDAPAREVWFAWGPAFGLAEARALVQEAARHAFARAGVLTQSRDGHAVPQLTVSDPGIDGEIPPRSGIWVQARQHAWESGSSWVCRGFVDWLVSADPDAVWLRRHADIQVVPIMDVDNVERGAGGKNQKPQDHNRDWSDNPHWPEVAAAQRALKAWDAEGRLDLFVDLHNPAAGDRRPFFFVTPDDQLAPAARVNQARFVAAAVGSIDGPLPISQRTRPSGPAYDPNWEKISKNWVNRNTADHVVAVTLETSWNTPHSHPEGYQTVGRQLGLAMVRFFRERGSNVE